MSADERASMSVDASERASTCVDASERTEEGVFVFEDRSVLQARAAAGVIEDEYKILDATLGNGRFGKVKLGVRIATGEQVAIKVIKKPTGIKQIANIRAEVDILLKCDHPNVVKMYACYETDTKLYLVLELLKGGELFDSIVRRGYYAEQDARSVSRMLLNALKYLHDRGVCHRDLKPENLLLKDGSSTTVKITDFGLSRLFADEELIAQDIMQTPCGTQGYVAPEILCQNPLYSAQVDLWAVGVISYVLLCGFPPFYGDSTAHVFQQIRTGTFKFLKPWWDPISDDAKDFVSRLLVVDPRKRMTAAEALCHPWFRPTARRVDMAPSPPHRTLAKRHHHCKKASSGNLPAATNAGLNASLPASSLRTPLGLVSPPKSPRVKFAPATSSSAQASAQSPAARSHRRTFSQRFSKSAPQQAHPAAQSDPLEAQHHDQLIAVALGM